MTLSKTLFRLHELSRLIWVRILLIAALALVSVAVSTVLAVLVPEWLTARIDRASAARLLEILASSMLAVTTFSLSVMVSAHAAASAQATPRAHQLLQQDSLTQTVLATFLGAFIYALVSIFLLNAGVYTAADYVTVYLMSMSVLVLVVVTIVRWIAQLSDLGSLQKTSQTVEDTARAALLARVDMPCLNANSIEGLRATPQDWEVRAEHMGCVLHIDMAALQEAAEAAGGILALHVSAGDWVDTASVLASGTGQCADRAAICDAVTLGKAPSFRQDPVHGINVMAEIAVRALSPGVNDPGTAVDVLRRQQSLLLEWRDEVPKAKPRFADVYVKPLPAQVLLRAGLEPIARYGAGDQQVMDTLDRVLVSLGRCGSPQMQVAAGKMAEALQKRPADQD